MCMCGDERITSGLVFLLSPCESRELSSSGHAWQGVCPLTEPHLRTVVCSNAEFISECLIQLTLKDSLPEVGVSAP